MSIKSYPSLPSDAEPYKLQVAGHRKCGSPAGPMLRHPSRPIIYKWLQDNARGYREVAFYEKVYDANAEDAFRLLRPFVPKFFGIYRCPRSHDLYLGLSDNVAMLKHPNVCDIKLGTIGYRPETDLNKMRREEVKYAWRKDLGFMLCGMQMYDPTSGSHIKLNKQFCRSLKPEEIYTKALLTFLGPNPEYRSRMARAYTIKLMDLLAWFEQFGASSMTFCRTSLLLGHDNNSSTSSSEVVVSLIDFTDWEAKSATSEEETNSCELTTGFAHGLSVLITLMRHAIDD